MLWRCTPTGADVRSDCLLTGSFACLGLGRVCVPWVNISGRGAQVQEGSVPVVKARFAANVRLSGDIDLLAYVGRALWRRLLLVPRFVMGIACLRFGNLGGRSLFGFGR